MTSTDTTGTPVELTLALGPRCFPIPKKPIGSHSSLHQHSYFSITSASSLAYPVGSRHDLMDISRHILVESRDPPFSKMHLCFQLFLHALQEGQDLAEGFALAKPPQIHVIMDEKMPFLETPQLDPRKIGFDKSNMEGTFHTKATLCYPQQK